ncbi:MAG: TrmH family RNA methyltransferase [Bacteroidota bacterium]
MIERVPKEYLLSEFYKILTDDRIRLFEKIIAKRTNHITVISEDIFQEHNASAIIRTCDSFGIQTLHLIEKRNTYQVHEGISRGSNQWVTLEHHYSEGKTTTEILNQFKLNGYKIAATSPHAIEYDVFNLPINEPIALLFGAEKKGITNEAIQNADYLVRIPMYGFAESLNVSVAVAIILNELRKRLNQSTILWQLSEIEKMETLLSWCRKHIKSSNLIENDIIKKYFNKF